MVKIKIKNSGWSAGKPILILNKDTAKKINAHAGDRISIKLKNGNEITAIADLSNEIAPKGKVVVSTEILDFLNLKDNQEVDINVAERSRVVQFISKKVNCNELSKKEIYEIINAVTKNELSEIEIAFFLSAINHCGMTLDETEYLTEAIYLTGKKLKLKNKFVVDKHSIGGIPSNRTTPLVVSICAAAGLTFPKTSSRSITTSAATADVIESVCNVTFTLNEIKKIIKKTNACMVWGGQLGLAPADDKLIQIEKTINIDPTPNLLASILAKKLSVSSKYIVIDIPYGKTAKVTKPEALKLKKSFEKLSKRFKMKLRCVLTDGSQPIGNAIGPVLEMIDVIKILQGDGPKDLREKAILLAGEIFELCKKTRNGKKMAKEILDSGKALAKFMEIIKAQGADIKSLDKTLSLAKFSHTIRAKKSTSIKEFDNKKINLLGKIPGCPKDKKAGLYIHKHVGEKIKKGEPILTIYSSSKELIKSTIKFYEEFKPITFK